MEQLKIALLTLVIFLTLDLAWIGGLMTDFYLKEMGPLVRKKGTQLDPNWISAALVYICITLGLVYFVYPSVQEMTAFRTFVQGALFGIVLYGVYDLTNHSLINNYSLKMTVVDILWGAFACGFTTLFVKWLSSKF